MSEKGQREFDFMSEQLKKKPFYKMRWFRKGIGACALAILFGAAAGITFSVVQPSAKKQFGEPEGRLIGDGMYYMIADIVVQPNCQKHGIGSRIINMLTEYVDKETPIGGRSSIQLIAEKGKEIFYEKLGFKIIPHEFCGSGMRKVIRK